MNTQTPEIFLNSNKKFFLKDILPKIQLVQPGTLTTVLDLGCGDGALCEVLGSHYAQQGGSPDNFQYIGIDPDQQSINQASSHFKNASFHLGGIGDELPRPESPIRLALCCEVFSILADWRSGLEYLVSLSPDIIAFDLLFSGNPSAVSKVLPFLDGRYTYHVRSHEEINSTLAKFTAHAYAVAGNGSYGLSPDYVRMVTGGSVEGGMFNLWLVLKKR